MSVALILAAGGGERLGAGRPKGLVQLAGRPLLVWSLRALLATQGVERIAIAMPPGEEHADLGLIEEGRPPGAHEIVTVAGGASRSQSVRLALAAVGPGDPVLVHDAARPLLTPQIAGAVLAALAEDPSADGAIAAAAVTDTVKRAGSDHSVLETLDRGALWAVQTPQVFRRHALEQALEVGEDELARATDDAWLVERRGGRILLVPTPAENLKVTTPVDLRVAELLLGAHRGNAA